MEEEDLEEITEEEDPSIEDLIEGLDLTPSVSGLPSIKMRATIAGAGHVMAEVEVEISAENSLRAFLLAEQCLQKAIKASKEIEPR